MAIAERLKEYLRQQGTDYELIEHLHVGSSMEAAEEAHIPGDALAKGVVVKQDGEYLILVLPADYQVDLAPLQRTLQGDLLLADEDEFVGLFPDCEPGAVPPIGMAYGLRTIWDPDTSLSTVAQVCFEAGDHERLVRVSGEDFKVLMKGAQTGRFSRHLE